MCHPDIEICTGGDSMAQSVTSSPKGSSFQQSIHHPASTTQRVLSRTVKQFLVSSSLPRHYLRTGLWCLVLPCELCSMIVALCEFASDAMCDVDVKTALCNSYATAHVPS